MKFRTAVSSAESSKKYRLENLEKCKTYGRRFQKELRLKKPDYYVGFFKTAREYIRSLKSKPCADCGGVFDPVCMDFDHVRGVKVIQVSRLVGCRKEKILEEVAKCDIVCSNCHRVRTYNRLKNKFNEEYWKNRTF